jgi:hypothetical protein
MASMVEVALRVVVSDPNSTVAINRELPPVRFTCASGLPKQEVVSLTGAASTALSPPSGAQAVVIELGSATSITLKGVSGDTGITCAPASNPLGGDLFLWLGAAPAITLTNGGVTVSVPVLWL